MLGHVITHETLHQVQLKVVLLVEIVACDGLSIGVVIVGVALVSKCLQQLLLPLKSQFGQNALLEVDLEALHCVLHLHEGLRLHRPGAWVGLESVQALGLLLLEKLGLGHLRHYYFI